MTKTFAGVSSETLVSLLYEHLLGRPADGEARDKVTALETGRASVEDIVREFIMSDEFRGVVSPASPPPERFTNDQTQFGEFELILKRWIARSTPNQIVVDVGARGRERSNAYDLLKNFGWRGVLFEANPNLIASINRDFEGLDYDLIGCAVSDYEGEATFYLGVNDDVSSLDQTASIGWGPIAGEVQVLVRRLGPILEERQIPLEFGLLSIDIEGEDIRVLNDVVGVDGYRPQLIIIEASYDFTTKSLDDLPFSDAVKASYVLVEQTEANLILELVTPSYRPTPGATGASAEEPRNQA